MRVRCSSLPLLSKCQAAGVAPTVPLASGGPEANLGTAAHEALVQAVAGFQADMEAIAQKHDVDQDALARLYFAGLAIWEQIVGNFAGAETEVPREP